MHVLILFHSRLVHCVTFTIQFWVHTDMLIPCRRHNPKPPLHIYSFVSAITQFIHWAIGFIMVLQVRLLVILIEVSKLFFCKGNYCQFFVVVGWVHIARLIWLQQNTLFQIVYSTNQTSLFCEGYISFVAYTPSNCKG